MRTNKEICRRAGEESASCMNRNDGKKVEKDEKKRKNTRIMLHKKAEMTKPSIKVSPAPLAPRSQFGTIVAFSFY